MLMALRSLIQHVAQLSLPFSRWVFLSSSRISSNTSPGSFAKISPGLAFFLNVVGWLGRWYIKSDLHDIDESLDSKLDLLLLHEELRERESKLSLGLLMLVTVTVDACDSFRGLFRVAGIASTTPFVSAGAVCRA